MISAPRTLDYACYLGRGFVLRGCSKDDTTSLAEDDSTDCEVDSSDNVTFEASDLINVHEGLG